MLRIWLKSIRKKDISMLGIKFSSWINLKRYSAPSDSIRASRPRARGRKARRQVSREERLMVEMHCWSQLLLGFSEEILVNRARKILSNQIRLYKLNIKTVLNLTH
jgi:hypothetical protein